MPPDSLVEVLGHVYGLNDAPSAWQKTLNQALLDVGFVKSRFDPCVYYLREDNGSLVGVYGVHVDDCATGGSGPKYEQALEKLRQRFEFRKWRIADGDFCGARYRQDPTSCAITMTQEGFVEKLRPLKLSRGRQAQKSIAVDDGRNSLSSCHQWWPELAGDTVATRPLNPGVLLPAILS